MPSRITSRPQPFLNRPWDLPELHPAAEGTPLFGVIRAGYLSSMALGRLIRRLLRTPPRDREIRPTGSEFGWALREVSGEARHPTRQPKTVTPDSKKPAAS